MPSDSTEGCILLERRPTCLAPALGVPLEPTILVVVPPAERRPGAGHDIRRDESRPPHLSLPDVLPLVSPVILHLFDAASQNDMSQSHRLRLHPARGEEPLRTATPSAEDTLPYLAASPRQPGEKGDEQAGQSCRPGPKINEQLAGHRAASSPLSDASPLPPEGTSPVQGRSNTSETGRCRRACRRERAGC